MHRQHSHLQLQSVDCLINQTLTAIVLRGLCWFPNLVVCNLNLKMCFQVHFADSINSLTIDLQLEKLAKFSRNTEIQRFS